jgi:hypothetical protein
MSRSDTMSLKTFWETVERRLAACSGGQLRAILRSMAQEMPLTRRQTFLETLERVQETGDALENALRQDDLLADVAHLAGALKAVAELAGGRHGRPGREGYDDQGSARPYAEFVEPLEALFDRAEAAFDYGHLPLARAAYQGLFEILRLQDSRGRGVSVSSLTGVDGGHAFARYLRAVYETEPLESRPQALFERMQPAARYGLVGLRPSLGALLRASPRPLPDREHFITDWIAFLRLQSGGAADAWLREAVRLSQGTEGLEMLARTEGRSRPRAYLDWFDALEEEDRLQDVFAAALEALQALPPTLPIRAAIADHLCAAAARLSDAEALHAGRWEAFLAQPLLSRLLDLWDAAPTEDKRTLWMRLAVAHVRDRLAHPPVHHIEVGWDADSTRGPVWVGTLVLAHGCLLAGEFDAARRLAEGGHVLGWSTGDNPQGLITSTFLVLLSGHSPDELPPNLAQVWQWGLDSGTDSSSSAGAAPVRERLKGAYAERFATASLSDGAQESLLSWCLDVAQRRVGAIVGGERRGSYGRVAVLTAACAEVLRLRGQAETATALAREMGDRFPGHRAFQTELRAALQNGEFIRSPP